MHRNVRLSREEREALLGEVVPAIRRHQNAQEAFDDAPSRSSASTAATAAPSTSSTSTAASPPGSWRARAASPAAPSPPCSTAWSAPATCAACGTTSIAVASWSSSPTRPASAPARSGARSASRPGAGWAGLDDGELQYIRDFLVTSRELLEEQLARVSELPRARRRQAGERDGLGGAARGPAGRAHREARWFAPKEAAHRGACGCSTRSSWRGAPRCWSLEVASDDGGARRVRAAGAGDGRRPGRGGAGRRRARALAAGAPGLEGTGVELPPGVDEAPARLRPVQHHRRARRSAWRPSATGACSRGPHPEVEMTTYLEPRGAGRRRAGRARLAGLARARRRGARAAARPGPGARRHRRLDVGRGPARRAARRRRPGGGQRARDRRRRPDRAAARRARGRARRAPGFEPRRAAPPSARRGASRPARSSSRPWRCCGATCARRSPPPSRRSARRLDGLGGRRPGAAADARARRLPRGPAAGTAPARWRSSTSRASRPARLAERRALSSPLRDLAGLLRSYDHLARMVLRHRGDRPEELAPAEALDRGLPRARARRLRARASRAASSTSTRAARRVRDREGDVRVRLRGDLPAGVALRSARRDDGPPPHPAAAAAP